MIEKWIESEGPKPDYKLLCVRLSDELDQLRSRNAELEAEVARYKSNIDTTEAATGMCGIYAKLEAEIARLRKALKATILMRRTQLAMTCPGDHDEECSHGEEFDSIIQHINKALEASDG